MENSLFFYRYTENRVGVTMSSAKAHSLSSTVQKQNELQQSKIKNTPFQTKCLHVRI